MLLNIGVARFFDWGRPKPQIAKVKTKKRKKSSQSDLGFLIGEEAKFSWRPIQDWGEAQTTTYVAKTKTTKKSLHGLQSCWPICPKIKMKTKKNKKRYSLTAELYLSRN